MTTQERAEKKAQIAIDKMIELIDMVDENIAYHIGTALEILREVESHVSHGKLKNGIIVKD